MKYLAHLEKDLKSDSISIYEVIKGLNSDNPKQWEGRIYYSLWYGTPMIAKVRSYRVKPHFAFMKGTGGNEKSGGGEGLEHGLAKRIICENKSFKIKIGTIEDELLFSEMKAEFPFENGLYVTDLYAKIKNENKFGIPVDSWIAIELHYTNKVLESKKRFYRNNGIASIEMNIWKEISYNGDIDHLRRRLIGYFNRPQFAHWLHKHDHSKLVDLNINEKNCSKATTDFNDPAGLTVNICQHEKKSEINLIKKNVTVEVNQKKTFLQRLLDYFQSGMRLKGN